MIQHLERMSGLLTKLTSLGDFWRPRVHLQPFTQALGSVIGRQFAACCQARVEGNQRANILRYIEMRDSTSIFSKRAT